MFWVQRRSEGCSEVQQGAVQLGSVQRSPEA
jgi:hypothetical protein